MNAVIVDLGGGSTELVFAANGIIDDISSLPTGSVSLTERYVQSDPPSERDLRRLRKAIRKSFNSVVGDPDYAPQVMIGAGGTFMALANISIRLRGQSFSSIGGYELSRSEVRHILDYLRHMPLRERRSVPGLNADRADIIVAGLVVIDRFMKYLKVNRLLIHDRGVRDGLLLNMISQAFGKKLVESDEKLDPLASVQQFAAACGFEQRHSQHVTRMALEIFDQLREPLGLAPEERLLLEAAGLLHEIGYLINYEKHHLHSYHLIMHGNFRGLSPRQRELVANIARYHRRSGPKKKHDNFACLTPEDQAVVRRLAAILRLADGLDRTHMQRVKTLQCHWKKDHVLIIVGADRLPDVDLWGAQKKGKLFQKVLGLGLVLAWHPTENQKLETKN
jgi:exopolyphosphatase/guanosine-5'-triphosphate,3'-diphosphate pyrophosphatase